MQDTQAMGSDSSHMPPRTDVLAGQVQGGMRQHLKEQDLVATPQSVVGRRPHGGHVVRRLLVRALPYGHRLQGNTPEHYRCWETPAKNPYGTPSDNRPTRPRFPPGFPPFSPVFPQFSSFCPRFPSAAPPFSPVSPISPLFCPITAPPFSSVSPHFPPVSSVFLRFSQVYDVPGGTPDLDLGTLRPCMTAVLPLLIMHSPWLRTFMGLQTPCHH